MGTLRDQLLQHNLVAAPPAEERWTHLRALVTTLPSSEGWDALVAHIDAWPADDPERAAALEYANAHLDAAWPDDLRVAPDAWWAALDDAPNNPRWALVRSLCLSFPPPSRWGYFTWRRTEHAPQPSPEVLAKLIAHAAPLRVLVVEEANAGALITEEVFEALGKLHTLTLSDVALSPNAVRRLCGLVGPALRALTLRRCALQHTNTPELLGLPPHVALCIDTGPIPSDVPVGFPLDHASADLVCLVRDLDAGRATTIALHHREFSDEASRLWWEALVSPGMERVDHVRIEGCSASSARRLLTALAKIKAPALERLTVTSCDLDNTALYVICDGPWSLRLTELVLDHCPIGGEGLRVLDDRAQRLPQLKRLSLRGCELDDAALALLGQSALLDGLEALELQDNRCDVSDDLIAFVRSPRLRGLKRLGLCELGISMILEPSALQALTSAPVADTLEELDIAYCRAPFRDLVALVAYAQAQPELKVSIHDAQRLESGFGAVWDCARRVRSEMDWSSRWARPSDQQRRPWHLWYHSVHGPNPDTLMEWAELDVWANVDALNLAHTAVIREFACALASSPTLAQHPIRALNLRDTCLTAEGLDHLTRAPWWPHLEALDLSYNERLGDSLNSAMAAGRLDHIVRLNVDHTRLGDRAVARWRRRPSRALRHFSARGNRLTSDGLSALLGLPALASLDVSFNPLHSGTLKPPRRRRPEALADLRLRGTQPPHDALGRVIGSGRLDALHTLDLGCNGLTGAAASALLGRASWPLLADLRLDRNPLGPRGLRALDTLESAELVALDLGRAELRTSDLEALTRQPWTTKLDTLALSGNPLTSGIGARLGAVDWARLRVLLLDHVPLGAVGVRELIRDTNLLDRLDALSLSAAKIDDRALGCVLQAPCYRGLRALFLALNPLGGDGIEPLVTGAAPAGLAALDLRGIPLRAEQRAVLRGWRETLGVRVHWGELRGAKPEGRAAGLRDQIWRAARVTGPSRSSAHDAAAPWRALDPTHKGRWFLYYFVEDE